MRPVIAAALLPVLSLLAACAGAPAPPSAAGGSGAPREAERLYRSRCSGCHRPYEPSTRTMAEWRAALARMAPKAHLTPPEQERLGAYLAAGASDAVAPGR